MRPESPDLPQIKRSIEAQLDDYERATAEYAVFVAGMRARHRLSEAAE